MSNLRDTLVPSVGGFRLYTLISRDTEFYVVGPFISGDEAHRWNTSPQNNPGDDPRWQSILLRTIPTGVRVVEPFPDDVVVETVNAAGRF